jgi:hypothetical protein
VREQDSGLAAADAVPGVAGPSSRVADRDELEDLIADAIGDSMDMDWTSRDGARAVVRALLEDGAVRFGETCWLIEWPATADRWATYWHPVRGWTNDASRAQRFCRAEDALASISTSRFCSGVEAREHKFISGIATSRSLEREGGFAAEPQQNSAEPQP